MQVSQIAELDTHAVIGGGKAEAFGMSESAEFFTVLSDTLYRDKVRAVAREVICNAWDAHIMAGKTDQPIEIRLTEQELVIKDHGPGIAPERMRPIYCIYGASTKVADENQTGGFGLGSKAPFAYSDHFSVTSAHAGLRTVYAVSRGGAETDGKPDMRAMVTTPTTASGITVSIPIRNEADRYNFEQHVKTVVRQGGILATLNGEQLASNNYDPARKQGYCLVKPFRDMSESAVYVLYGTVLYPLTTTNVELNNKVRQISGMLYNDRLVLIAPPNSVGVTPSRESLSYSDKTIKTCVDLMDTFIGSLKHDGQLAVRAAIKAKISKVQRHKINYGIHSQTNDSGVLSSLEVDRKIMAQAVALAKPDLFTTSDQRLRAMYAALGKRFRDDRRIFRRMGGKASVQSRSAYRWGAPSHNEKEIYKHTLRLPMRFAIAADLLSNFFLFVSDAYYESKKIVTVDENSTFRTVSNRILVSPSQREALKRLRADYSRDAKSGRRNSEDLTAVFIPKKMTAELRLKIDEVAARLNLSVDYLDFPQRKKPTKSSEKVAKGLYLSFDKIRSPSGYRFEISEAKTLVKAPAYYMTVRGGLQNLNVDSAYYAMRGSFQKYYGEIALATTTKVEAKLKASGAKNIDTALIDDLRKLASTREVAFAFMCRRGLSFGTAHSRSPANTVSDLCFRELRFAAFLFPEAKIKFGADAEKAEFLMSVMENRFNRGVNRKAYSALWEEVRKIAEADFEDMVMTAEQANKRFAWLKPLADGYFRLDDHKASYDVEEILTLLRFLKRRAVKTVNEPLNTDDNALKEAA